MSKPPAERSLWEYALPAISVLATLVQLLGLISQSQAFFAQPSVTTAFAIIVLAGTAIGCIFALRRTKLDALTGKVKVPYYTTKQRLLATGVLATNVLVSILVLGAVSLRPCLSYVEPINAGKFGILVADFTDGPGRNPTPKGSELADRTSNSLNRRLAASTLEDRVQVQRVCAVRTVDEALRAGQTANASLILWGNAAEFAEDSFTPSFTFVNPLLWPSDIDPLIFEVELNRIDSADLPSKISARTTSIAAFVIGLIYLNQAQGARDYELAIRELSFAISNTEPELATLSPGSEQELSIRRTLAIFYVVRGRAYATLDDSQRAFAEYSAAEAVDPGYASTYIAKGNYYYALRDFANAKPQYEKAISLREVSSAYYGLGSTLFYLGDHQESVDLYLKAISLIEAKGDDPSGVRLVLGTVYHIEGQEKLALEQLHQVLQSQQAPQSQKQQAQDTIASMSVSTSAPNATPTAFPTMSPTDTLFPTGTPTATLFSTTTVQPLPRLTDTLFPTGTPTDAFFPTPTPPPSPPTRTSTLFPTPTVRPTPPG